MTHALAFLIAALAAIAVTPLVVRVAERLGLLDTPGPRKVHDKPVPRIGGVAIAIAAAAAVASVQAAAGAIPGPDIHLEAERPILLGALLVFAIGLADDVRPVAALVKLAVHLLAAAVPLAYGIRIERFTIAGTTCDLGALAPLVTVLWIVGITNAFNLMDGLDGLATGLAIIASATCAIILIRRGHTAEALLLTSLLGAAAGFLPYNFAPARIFLGDSGSLLFGFVLATTAITGWQKGATALSVGGLLMIFALPLVDTGISVVRRGLRAQRGESRFNLLRILVSDQEHIHHRLLQMGLSQRAVVVLLYTLSVALSWVALLVMRVAD